MVETTRLLCKCLKRFQWCVPQSQLTIFTFIESFYYILSKYLFLLLFSCHFKSTEFVKLLSEILSTLLLSKLIISRNYQVMYVNHSFIFFFFFLFSFFFFLFSFFFFLFSFGYFFYIPTLSFFLLHFLVFLFSKYFFCRCF